MTVTEESPIRIKRPTLRDVAERANCSTAIVSKVLNRSKSSCGASEELTTRIQAAAEQLGYHANFASQSLVRSSTRTIGVYVPPTTASNITYPYESRILRGIEQVCQREGYDVMLINMGGETRPQACARRILEGRVEGVVLLHLDHRSPWLSELLKQTSNVTAVNYYGTDAAIVSVNFADYAATQLAVDHLASSGHRRIGYLGYLGRAQGPGEALRYDGYCGGMAEKQLTINPAWAWASQNEALAPRPSTAADSPAGVEAAIDHFLGLQDDRPTALVCHGDVTASEAIRCLRSRNLSVPHDMSIVGVDDSEVALFSDPQLTTIRQPLEEMGARATALLFDIAAGSMEIGRQPLMQPQLVIRESVEPLKA